MCLYIQVWYYAGTHFKGEFVHFQILTNPLSQPGAVGMESSSAEKEPGVLVEGGPADREPATCPHSKGGQRHPGLREGQRGSGTSFVGGEAERAEMIQTGEGKAQGRSY